MTEQAGFDPGGEGRFQEEGFFMGGSDAGWKMMLNASL